MTVSKDTHRNRAAALPRLTSKAHLTLGEPTRVTDMSAVTWLQILAGLAEKFIRDLAPLV